MKRRPLCIVCLAFLIIRSILLIFTSGESFVEIPASSVFAKPRQKTEVIIEGQVYKKSNTSNIQILYLKENSLIHDNKSYKESNILIYDDNFSDIPIGKRIRIKGTLTSFEKARNPGNFDRQLYYAKQNIYGFVWSEEILRESGKECKLKEWLYQIRQSWKLNLTEHMSEKNGAVLSAMLLSEKSLMEPELREQYQKAGISHVLAISGLHISFIGLGIYKLLRRSGLSYPVAGVLAIMSLTGYTLMIGFSVSVFRAYLMLLLRIGADITGRVYDMLTAVMLSAALLVAYQPLYLTDAAFYLSHGAILGLILVLPKLKQILPQKKWMESVYASIAINIVTFPILLCFYYEFSLYAMLTNLVVIPLMSLVLSFGMFGSLGCFVCKPIGSLLLWNCDFILSVFEWLSKTCCRLPVSVLTLGKPNWWEVAIYYVLLILFLVLPYKKRGVKAVLLNVACVAFCILFFVKFPNGQLQVTVLDVGQGDCIFMRGPNGNTYLIDGGSSDVKEPAKYRIEPFLKSQGVGSLDYVFVSHGDTDHYIGIQEMIGRQMTGVKIKRLILPANYQEDEELKGLAQEAMEQGVRVMVIKEGEIITERELQIQCLQPGKEHSELTGNAGSMVLDITFGKLDMLFTGDVEAIGEDMLLSKLPQKRYDILKVAHHGSKNATTKAFLNKIRPKIAWISAGMDNSYGHPHQETLERLEGIGCEIYQTTKYGAITMESDGEFIDIFASSI